MPINKILLSLIKEMYSIDQSIRKQVFKNPSLLLPLSQFGRMHEAKEVKQRPNNLGLGNYLIYIVDHIHNAKIKHILEKYGFPNSKLIGKLGIKHFSVLILHQDSDIELQRLCLRECEFRLQDKAILQDRILRGLGRKQLYGTQFYVDHKNKIVKSIPISNPKMVNRRRKAMGLDSIKKSKQEIERRMNF